MPKRTIFIGDIQGCYDEFIELLSKCNYNPTKDQLFLVGDTINRGPKSKEVLDYLIAHPEINVVMGNHEYYFLQSLSENKNGNFEHLKKSLKPNLEDYIKKIQSWPFYIENKNWILVHAGLEPQKELSEISEKSLCSLRYFQLKKQLKPWFEFYTKSKLVIFGHWAKMGLVDRYNVKGLDTGCVYGRTLTAWILEEKKFVSVPAKKIWYDPIKNIENW